ncbi:sulfurtransferase complex subunit TusB [Candidatus Reidiella endopervernicosa]|uniref:Sulfurtransferase complex subunit TusB n=1 Tax=Candidatus Reidiella endopervernicosa TaxID=2738883 RepID=A0A6N0HWX9_9GAMM|nr:sulfurtransferase complex subunit TusB [Candidatus Reidiella endopervernicosa]QKQ26761.1 sulfurtransferase complex subunit TusB [Candidatus Reidiella endopervernicosa]
MLLHTVNKSPFEKNALDSCLRMAKAGSSILLIEDGVYAATNNTSVSEKVKGVMGDITVYALEEDVKARGMQDKVMDGIKLVDYAGFVDLVAESDNVSAWL